MNRISSKPDCLPTIFLSRTKIFYNNSNKLQIELLYALVSIAIGLEYIKNIWFQGFMNPLRNYEYLLVASSAFIPFFNISYGNK